MYKKIEEIPITSVCTKKSYQNREALIIQEIIAHSKSERETFQMREN